MRRLLLITLSFAFIAGCAAPQGIIKGRVMSGEKPVAGAAVAAKATDGETFTAISGADGIYSFPPLPSGEFEVSASSAGGEQFVTVWGATHLFLPPGGEEWVWLKLAPREGVIYTPYEPSTPGFGAISGIALFEGEPISGATANIYLDERESLKGPGFRHSFPTGADGRFYIDDIPDGEYFLAVRKREGRSIGPIAAGDLFGVASANPITVKPESDSSITVHLAEKEKTRAPHALDLSRSGTAIRGRVVDAGGAPLAGLYVFAYRSRIIGHQMPDFITEPTGADGEFVLPLGEGGLFYLGARQKLGYSPTPGELFGLYDGAADHGIKVQKGEVLEGVKIIAEEVLP
ncbi:MAG: hypothetical protein C0609_08535 [Deltaproteobacteria bacterium]|nr:MAG: hypothetical protein C0609_08535 [Deltaproteobacteria bacterium]